MTQAHDPWQQRYGSVPPPELTPTLQAQLQHRSIRRYSAQPVSDASLQRAVAAAQSASTSSNLQLWTLIAVRDPERKLALAKLAGHQSQVRDAPLLLLWVADLSRLQRIGARSQQPTAGCEYLEGFVLASVDTALAAQNAAVALESEGLGLVYIGAMRNQPQAVARLLELPPGAMVLFGMCVGYPDPQTATAIKPRLPMPTVLHHERYDGQAELAGIAEYESRLAAFQQGQQRETPPWTQQAVARMADAAALNGRDRLHEALQALGFGLK